MNKLILLLLLPIGVTSCNFRKSVNMNLNTGLVTKGSGLSCEDAFIVVNDEKVTRNEFHYAEKIELYFESIEGLVRKKGAALFGMKMLVLNKQGDTILFQPDLYAEAGPVGTSKPTLKPYLSIGLPIASGKEYTLSIHIWDKNGTGTLDATLPFTVKRNSAMKIERSQISFKECYLVDEKTQLVITGDEVQVGSTVNIALQGLGGFQANDDGMCALDAELVLQDAYGNELLHELDMMGERLVPDEQLKEAFTFYVSLPDNAKGKMTVTAILRDKATGKWVKATVKLKAI